MLNGIIDGCTSCFGMPYELQCRCAHPRCRPGGYFRDTALTSLPRLQQRATPAIANSFARSYAADAKASPTEVSSILEQRIRGVQEEAGLAETGRVLSVGYGNIDNIAETHRKLTLYQGRYRTCPWHEQCAG